MLAAVGDEQVFVLRRDSVTVEKFKQGRFQGRVAVGRPEAWLAAMQATAPGGVVVLVGGCPRGTEMPLATGPIHYDELELRGAFHHSPADVEAALAALAAGDVDWELLQGETISLEQLPAALAQRSAGAARKWVVDPLLRSGAAR